MESIAQFKLREGQPIGCHVTLRGDRMWEFLDRTRRRSRCRASATSVVCPPSSSTAVATTPSVSRSRSCSTRSNQDKIDRVRQMDITLVTATNDAEGLAALLRHLGFPFKEA
ncbi:Large ribosomal subunit protein uL5 OS=Streptomyces alboniger OX=132473 GN=rplE PE=3 SV=1 [Streptomyces alboniger]